VSSGSLQSGVDTPRASLTILSAKEATILIQYLSLLAIHLESSSVTAEDECYPAPVMGFRPRGKMLPERVWLATRWLLADRPAFV
jgi:hypothetical protein